MSLNLHCKEVKLWQTPTYITKMCYYKYGGIRDDWRNIKYRYIFYIESHLDGVWESEIDYKYMKNNIRKHIKELNKFEKLTFEIG